MIEILLLLAAPPTATPAKADPIAVIRSKSETIKRGKATATYEWPVFSDEKDVRKNVNAAIRERVFRDSGCERGTSSVVASVEWHGAAVLSVRIVESLDCEGGRPSVLAKGVTFDLRTGDEIDLRTEAPALEELARKRIALEHPPDETSGCDPIGDPDEMWLSDEGVVIEVRIPHVCGDRRESVLPWVDVAPLLRAGSALSAIAKRHGR